jgi:hypothetical protein
MNTRCRSILAATLLTTNALAGCGGSDVERIHPKPVVFNAVADDVPRRIIVSSSGAGPTSFQSITATHSNDDRFA